MLLSWKATPSADGWWHALGCSLTREGDLTKRGLSRQGAMYCINAQISIIGAT